MIKMWQKVRVIDYREKAIEERAIAVVVDVTKLLRQKLLKIRFDSGEILEVDSSEVEVLNES